MVLPRASRTALAVASAVLLIGSLPEEARAQPIVDPSATTPAPPQRNWPQVSDEALYGAPPPSPATPELPEPAPAAEPPAPPFGAAGEVVITGDSSIGISSTRFSRYDASAFSAQVSPGVDIFVVNGLSLGVDVNVSYVSTAGYGAGGALVSTTSSRLGGGPRLGVNVPLGTFVSWYPRATVGVESVRLEVKDSATSTFDTRVSTSSETAPFVAAFAPLLFHPKPHFFVGLGPSVRHAFGGARGGQQIGLEQTTLSARLVIGGWWGGTPPTREPDAPLPQAAASVLAVPRFGNRRQWVLTGELGGGVARTDRNGAGASTVVSVVPGFDYFVGRRISVGMSATAYRSHAVLAAPSGKVTTNDVSSFGIGARLGVDQPLSPTFSFYPRASISVGRETVDVRSGSQTNDASSTVLTLGVYAPLLVHVATHAFAGFGPYISHDALRRADDRPGDTLATRVGASLLVGGWL